MEDTKETPVLDFDPADCLPADDDRPAERPGINRLIESIAANGVLVPGQVCPHPNHAGKYLLLDGIGRWHACVRLRIKFKALLLPGVVPEAERIKRRLQCNVIRRNMTPEEIADDATSYMKLTGCTQEVAAKELTISSASLSRALSVHRRIPASLKHKAELVRPSIAALIAALPTVEAMEQAFDFATTPGADGKLPSREAVARCLAQYKTRKQRGPKAKKLKGQVEGRTVELSLVPGETTASLVAFLKALAVKIGEHPKVPPENLGFVFNG